VCVVEKSNKKNYQTKTGKKFNSKQKLKKIKDSLLALIYGKLRRIESRIKKFTTYHYHTMKMI
jgi:hypothetical protein